MASPSERNVTIDVAKGISIILVAFGHSQLKRHYPDIHTTLGLIRMPLFFFLSGVFFSSFISPASFFLKKTDALLKPYFVTLSVAALIYLLLDEPGIKNYIFGVLYGTGQTLPKFWIALWFLPHLWLVCLAAYVVQKYSVLARLPTSTQILICLLALTVSGYFIDIFRFIEITHADSSVQITGLPFSADLLVVTLSYFLVGTALNVQVKTFRPNALIVVGCFIIYACIIYFTDAFLELNSRQFQAPVWCIIGSAIGIYLMLSLAYGLTKIPHVGRWLMTAGYTSLFILLFHGLIKGLAYKPLVKLFGKEHKVAAGLIAFLLSITLPLVIKWLVERHSILRKLYLPIRKKS